jgi:hypothetical protein
MHRINFVLSALFKSCFIKIIVSYAYYLIDTPPSTRCGISPTTFLSLFALAMRIANISTMILNKMGDIGSP